MPPGEAYCVCWSESCSVSKQAQKEDWGRQKGFSRVPARCMVPFVYVVRCKWSSVVVDTPLYR
jgi:hypothetical protein